MLAVLCLVYGVLALNAGMNLALMRRPQKRLSKEGQNGPRQNGPSQGGPSQGGSSQNGASQGGARPLPQIAVLIPARDEEANLERLLPQLFTPNQTLKVYVFDDESSDRTAEVAAGLGATVLRPAEPLPPGWAGKNRACHQLGQAAAEDSDAEWIIFLDADVRPQADFIPALQNFLANLKPSTGVVSGFPTILSGEGIEPLFLGWVGWVLLATNPFGLVARTGKGHNQFTNGQCTLWRQSVYTQLWPNERLKGAILEDVRIGRLLAKEKIGLEVANFSGILQVRMYDTWRQTLDGMSKNSFEITGTAWGTMGIALLFLALGWGWLAAGPQWYWPLGILALSGLFVSLTARANLLLPVLMPVVLTLGSFTMVRSWWWRKTGQVKWKGRTYPS